MKKVLFTLLLAVSGTFTFAQAPEMISYQAIVRDNGGLSVVNQLVGVRVSILQGSAIGPEVFAETHGPTSNSYGLINLQIGTGSNTGPLLSTIDWGADVYFVKIEVDPTGGTTYSVSSVSQLLSVPYALMAKTAENVDDADSDPTNEYLTGGVVNATNLELTDGGGTTVIDMTTLLSDPDMDPNNEIQTLSKVGQIVTLSGGGGAFTDDVDDADNDNTNELNGFLNLAGTTLQLSDPGGMLTVDLSVFGDDADADPNNEIQSIVKVGNTVTLSNGGGSYTDAVDDADPDNTNELQTIGKVGNTVTLSDGGGSFTDAVDDADADPNNEFQTANKVGNMVTLSDGGGTWSVDDSDADATNEFNTGAGLAGNILSITDGGSTITVDLSPLVGGGDPSSTNELNTGGSLSGTILTITDAGGNTDIDLASIAAPSFKVGQFYQGGIIVYVDTTGIHGFIAAPSDALFFGDFDDAGDGNSSEVVAGSLIDGFTNTQNLVASAVSYPAADAANLYNANGFGDWFLPSIYQLEFILQNNYALAMHGAELAYGQFYWSSSQESPGLGLSAYIGESSGQTTQLDSEVNNRRVRCMRAF